MSAVVSVIIPVYNADKVIDRCLTSLLEQTLKHIEIIVVDDGSTDKTAQIIDRYAKEYKSIKFISQQNEGAGSARNNGLTHATGQFIGFVDADDYVMPSMYEELYKNIVETKSDCAICNYETSHNKVTLFEQTVFKVDTQTRTTGYIRYIAKNPVLWNKLYNRDCIDNLKMDTRMKVGEDLLFNTKAYENMRCIVVIDSVLYHYSDEEKSITRTNKKVNYKNMIRSYCDDELISEPELDVYQGLVFLTGFIFSTVMNKKSPNYVYNELMYLLQSKGDVFYTFKNSNEYYNIIEEDAISKQMYYAYKFLFSLSQIGCIWISALGFWVIAKLIRIGR